MSRGMTSRLLVSLPFALAYFLLTLAGIGLLCLRLESTLAFWKIDAALTIMDGGTLNWWPFHPSTGPSEASERSGT